MLRTPDACFEALPGWPYLPSYVEGLPELNGARMAYVDIAGDPDKLSGHMSGMIGAGGAAYSRSRQPHVALCLHGNPSWGYLYRKMAPIFAEAGLRVIIPDLIGFGRSDKPELESAHTFEGHRQSLLALIRHLDLRNVMLVVQDWGGLLGLTLPMAMPERIGHLLVMNTALATGEGLGEGFLQWRSYSNKSPDLDVGKMLRRGKPDMTADEARAYNAPFPDASYKAALRVFANLVPTSPDDPGAAISREAAEFLKHRWQGETFMAVGTQDPVLGPPAMDALRQTIRNCPAPMPVAGGHFVQEWGEPIARKCLKQFGF